MNPQSNGDRPADEDIGSPQTVVPIVLDTSG